MASKRVVYLGAKGVGAACLRELVDQVPALDAHIVGVLTNDEGDAVREICDAAGLPLLGSLGDLLDMDFDVLLCVQYHEILKAAHIERARAVAVNLHMAPLPEYRGCNQFSFAIVNGDAEFGTSLHVMTPAVDAGPLIAEDRFPIPEGCFVDELYRLTVERSIVLFAREIGSIIRGDYTTVSQEELRRHRPSSFHLRREIEELKRIDLAWPEDRIERHVRATLFEGFEPPYTIVGGRKVYLTRTWGKPGA